MRIALVYDGLYPWVNGGAERRYHELAVRLGHHHDVHLLAWQWWDGPAVVSGDGVTLHGLGRPPAMYGGDGKRTVREALAFSARVLPALLRGRWDVIDCSATPYLPVYPAWLVSRLTRTPLVVTWHEFWGDHWAEYLPHRPLVARVARALERTARGLGDRVVAVSDFTARSMGKSGSPSLDVVPNGVDAAAIAGSPPAEDGAELVYLGRLIDEKRVDLLLQAMVTVGAREPEVRCDLIGDGPERAALERLAATLGLDDRVRFLGRLPAESVTARLRAARLLLQPSGREGYGMVVAEAQAAGTVPIVAHGPFTAAPELVEHGVDGMVVDPTVEAMAAAVLDLLADPSRLDRLSEAAQRAGAARDWDRWTRQMELVYAAAIEGRVAPQPEGSPEWL